MVATIVGVFDKRSEAHEVQQDLVRAGFPESNIRLIDQSNESGLGSSEQRGDEGGFWSRVRDFFGLEDTGYYSEAARRGGTLITVDADEQQADRAAQIIEKHHPIDIDHRVDEWRAQGWTGQAMPTPMPAEGKSTGKKRKQAQSGQLQGEQSIPIVQEQLRVGTRREQRGGVRVYSRVTQQPVEEQVHLHQERVHVERRPVDRPATGDAFREQTIEATELREEPVVSKEARVVEEVVIRKDVEDRTETVRDTVRRTDVDIQNIDDKELRQDFQTHFAGKGMTYEQYQPAYAYGRELANDKRYSGKKWPAIESEVRSPYEQRHPGGKWDQCKDAVRRGYDQARSNIQNL